MSGKAKVFGIGLNKTGTTTLGVCLERLGYDHISNRRDLLAAWRRGDAQAVYDVIDRHDSFEDWPWPLMYEALADQYPDARFILTRRKSPEVWLKSLSKHALSSRPITHSRKLAYGYHYPHYAEAEHLAIYRDHLDAVPRFFEARGEADRLLTLCWEDGDGWPELGRFLGVPVPDEPLPKTNVAGADARQAGTIRRKTNELLIALGRAKHALLG